MRSKRKVATPRFFESTGCHVALPVSPIMGASQDSGLTSPNVVGMSSVTVGWM